MDEREKERLKRLEHWAFGNGATGADERLRNVEKVMERMSGVMERLESAERHRTHQEVAARRERRGFLAGMSAVLLLIGVGGVRFAVYLTERINTIMQVVGGSTPPF